MTKEEFLAALRLTPRNWILTKGGSIRLPTLLPHYKFPDYPVKCCPINSLVLECNDAVLPNRAGNILKLEYKLERAIMIAADYCFEHEDYNSQLRAQLIKACGLEKGL